MSANNSNGFTLRVAAGTTDAILATDDVVMYTGGAAKAVSLPAASVQRGKVYHLSNRGVGDATVTPASGTVNGAATLVVAAGTAAAPTISKIISDGTNWFTF